jgi:hypothetical protein
MYISLVFGLLVLSKNACFPSSANTHHYFLQLASLSSTPSQILPPTMFTPAAPAQPQMGEVCNIEITLEPSCSFFRPWLGCQKVMLRRFNEAMHVAANAACGSFP